MPPVRAAPRDRYAPYRIPRPQVPRQHSPTDYVDDLFKKVMQRIPLQAYREIFHDCQDYMDMMVHLPRPNWESSTMLAPMHWHPKSVIRAGTGITEFRDAALNANPGPLVIALAEKVISLWTSANSLRQLHRFIDVRQPALLEFPLPDGSNIRGDATPNDPLGLLHDEWKFRRAFIRHLHLPGLWVPGDRTHSRALSFSRLYGISRALLQMELDRCLPADINGERDNFIIDHQDPDLNKIRSIKSARNVIEKVLVDVAEEAFKEQQTAQARFFPNRAGHQIQMTRNEMLHYNLTPGVIHITLGKMIRKYEELMADHPQVRLVVDLLGKEDTLERLLTDEHVEDRLINKQIIPYDELSIVDGPECSPLNIEASFNGSGSGVLFDTFIHQVTKGISLVNRQRRNFRLTREWLRYRPWHALYHVYDSAIPGREWLRDAIAGFVVTGLRTPYQDDPFIPSHSKNVTSNLFGIHPIDIRDVTDRERRDFLHCAICNSDIRGGDGLANTIAVLPCDNHHSFHLACVMEHWDKECQFTQPCPTCYTTPALTHERLGMVNGGDDPYFDIADPTFVLNHFGYIIRPTRHPIEPPINGYNIPDDTPDSRFWQRENLLAAAVEQASVIWQSSLVTDRPEGYSPVTDQIAARVGEQWRLRNIHVTQADGYVMEDGYDAARFAPSEELAFMRKRRRWRDRNRRLRIAQAGQGLSRYKP